MLVLSTPLEVIRKFMYNPMLPAEKSVTYKKALKAITKMPLKFTESVKPSVFNYAEHNGNLHAVYNTLYCSTALLNDKEWELLQQPENGEEAVLRELFAAGFLVPRRVNEFTKLQKYKAKFRKFLRKDMALGLTIATTTKCNARCNYCFENNTTRADITPEVEENILKFVDKRIGKNKRLNITWFGGEPLLNTGLMERLSKYFKEKKYKVSASIVTNGSLLNEAILKTGFRRWKIKRMQITLDGTAENYARIKNYLAPELGNLERVLQNIDLAEKHKISVSIRLNINRENLDDLLKLAEQLDKRYADSKYVMWYIAALHGTDACFATEEEWLATLEKFMARHHKQLSIKKGRSLPKLEFCMAQMPKSYCIDVNGALKICWEDFTFSHNDIGNIRQFDARKDQRKKQSPLHPKCEHCVWLPMCGGGCIARRAKNEIECTVQKYQTIATLRQLVK